MKKILILCLMSGPIMAGDLIFDNGFEDPSMISGRVTGLTATGLRAALDGGSVSETIRIDANGRFYFSIEVPVGASWKVDITQLPYDPSKQTCTITNNTGVMTDPGADSLLIVCDDSTWNWDEMDWGTGGWN